MSETTWTAIYRNILSLFCLTISLWGIRVHRDIRAIQEDTRVIRNAIAFESLARIRAEEERIYKIP